MEITITIIVLLAIFLLIIIIAAASASANQRNNQIHVNKDSMDVLGILSQDNTISSYQHMNNDSSRIFMDDMNRQFMDDMNRQSMNAVTPWELGGMNMDPGCNHTLDFGNNFGSFGGGFGGGFGMF